MIFGKKKNDMIDLRELQKRGVVRIPKKEIIVSTNDDGFVELNQTKPTADSRQPTTESNSSFFGFMDNATPPPRTTTTDDSMPQPNQQDKRGYRQPTTDSRVTDLDNKIYKLEQRIELLEKKLDVNQSTNNVGVMGW